MAEKRKRRSISVRTGARKRKVEAVRVASYRSGVKRKREANASSDAPRKQKTLKRAPLLKTKQCPRCDVTLFCSDADSLCCGRTLKRQEPLIELPEVPAAWIALFMITAFGTHCRQYNNHFAFSAIASTHGIDRLPGGPSNLILHGKTYHRILPGQYETGPLRFFLYDGLNGNNDELELNDNWVTIIREELSHISPFWNNLKSLSKETAKFARLELTVTGAREIAALIVIDPMKPISAKTIVYWRQTKNAPVFLSSKSGLYFPLQYVLFAPRGEPGWNEEIKHKISQLAYYRQLLMRHKPMHMLGPLLNEFLVDIFSAVETDRLDFLRKQQKRVVRKGDLSKLRSDETISGEGDVKVGRVYLSSTFLGSPRHQQKLVADALAIVKRFGNPTFFITMSCNPKWPEIVDQLLPGQSAADRPDVTVRVFHGKLSQLFELIPTALKCGKIMYRIHVIEFQKRGLPHAHIAIKAQNEPVTADEIDEVISGCVPRDNAQLKGIIESLYIHSCRPERCHKKQKNADRYKQPRCDQKYPQPLTNKTYIDEAGYVRYKRLTEQDRLVVTYNPELTYALDCHINVDISHTVLLIMYLYKYFYKGVDRAKWKLEVVDEIAEYQDSRYLSASEAAWRFFGFETTRRIPSVDNYVVHVDKGNYVVYNKGNEDSVLECISPLERYFLRPEDPVFDNVTYLQYYEQYIVSNVMPSKKVGSPPTVFKDDAKDGKQRYVYERQSKHVARMDIKRPSAGEVYFLRMLLDRRPARSYDDLRTVDGVYYSTFSETAVAMGLVAKNGEADLCMQEAIECLQSRGQLRILFVLLINEGAPAVDLYNKFLKQLAKDYTVNHSLPEQEAENNVLTDISKKLECLGKSNTEFGLAEPLNRSTELKRMKLQFNSDHCMQQFNDKVSSLNKEQMKFLTTVRRKLDNSETGLIFLNGPAGRGKTYVCNLLLNYVRGQGQVALACASSAIAAMNYPGGRTAHNIFKIPVKDDYLDLTEIQCDVLPTGERAEVLRACRLVVWDEFSMMHRMNFEAVLKMLRNIRRNRTPAAGLVFICLGDFRQIPPVIRFGTVRDTINASMLSSSTWPYFHRFDLTIPVRQSHDLPYAEMLDMIGNGTIVENEHEEVVLELIDTTTDLNTLIDFVYPDLRTKGLADTTSSAILSLRNVVVDYINSVISSYLPSNHIDLFSHDSLNEDSNTDLQNLGISEEFLNTIRKPNTPPHTLQLKEGMHCYLLRNLSPDDGLLNNTKIKIQKITRQLITAELLSTKDVILIPRITFELDFPGNKLKINRKQFPVRCGYCKTYNRSQGDTLQKCGLDLREPPFEHGQLYVGASRTQTRHTILALCLPENITDDGHPRTVNTVYPELLLDQDKNISKPRKHKIRQNKKLDIPSHNQSDKKTWRMPAQPNPTPDQTFKEKYLEDHNLRIVPIMGDGECLYRTISYFLFDDNQSHHSNIRKSIAEELQNHPERYQDFLAANNDNEEPNMDELIKAVSTPGTWGSQVSLTAAANIYSFDYTILFSGHKLESDKHQNYKNYVFIYDTLFNDNLMSNCGHYSATHEQ